MARTFINSLFKIQAETLENTDGIFPEKGALVYDKSNNGVLMGDGFTWLHLNGGGTEVPDAVALALKDTIEVEVSTTPSLDIPFFNDVIYTFGDGMVPTIPDRVTMADSYFIDFSVDMTIESSRGNVNIGILFLVDGVVVSTREVEIPNQKEPHQVVFLNNFELTAGQVITIGAVANKSATITMHDFTMGLKEAD